MKALTADQVFQLKNRLLFPDNITIDDYIDSGKRAHVFKATLNGNAVVAKIYRPEMAQKYSRKYRVDIAEFEFQRNSALYQLETIQPHIAKPYCFFSKSGEYTQAFIQEYITGTSISKLTSKLGKVPEEIIRDGYTVVEQASEQGIHDLDINSGNVVIVKQEGSWQLKLCDFNLMPQHLHPSNPFLAIGFISGIRHKSHRDFRNLKKWANKSKQLPEKK